MPPPSPPNPYSDIVTPLVGEPPPSQLPRWDIRSMWELASILKFLNVFRPLLNIKAEFSVEELETALITPNNTLGEIYIPLLKELVEKLEMSSDAKLMQTTSRNPISVENLADINIPLRRGISTGEPGGRGRGCRHGGGTNG